MRVLTAAQMREVDRLTIEGGIPGIILMENAAHRVVEAMEKRFAPLASHSIAVLCGKGNNGGDGLAIARQLHNRVRPRDLHVIVPVEPTEGDALENLKMLVACGCHYQNALPPEARYSTLVVDAILGSGLNGPPSGPALDLIESINMGFPLAKMVAVDVPSGMNSDSGRTDWQFATADLTVTFTAPKICHVMPPNCDQVGELVVGQIGSRLQLYADSNLSLLEAAQVAMVLFPRMRDSHKGDFGHVLAWAGSPGKTGAAAMTGLAALRAGAGLVTVASHPDALAAITAVAPELMTEPESKLDSILAEKSVLVVGPGLGSQPETVTKVRRLYETVRIPMVIDADGLNALAGASLMKPAGPRVLTPHPGEMARLTGLKTDEVQEDRIEVARAFSIEHGVTVVLKGHRTVIAFPHGNVWINPTGSPAMAKAGSGDILTGLIAGWVSQFPSHPNIAINAAVYLHGRAGEIGASKMTDKCLIATDLLRFMPDAIQDVLSS